MERVEKIVKNWVKYKKLDFIRLTVSIDRVVTIEVIKALLKNINSDQKQSILD